MAIDRSHDMADERAFLLPVTIDDTSDVTALVPEKFREVQWIHLPDGVASETLAHRVQALLEGTASGATNAPFAARRSTAAGSSSGRGRAGAKARAADRRRVWFLGALLVVTAGVAWVRFSPARAKPAPVVAAPARAHSLSTAPPMDELDTGWDMGDEDPSGSAADEPAIETPSSSEMAGDGAPDGGDQVD